MLLIKHTKIETCKSPVIRERHLQDLPGHLAAKTLYFHCRGHGFDPQWGSQDLKYQAPWPKKFIKLKKKKAPSSETVAEIAKPWLSFLRWGTQAWGSCLTAQLDTPPAKAPQGQGPLSSPLCPAVPGRV